MKVKGFFSKGWPTRMGFYLGRYFPPRSGNTFAAMGARMVTTLRPDVYHSVRANLRQVLGPETEEQALNQAVRQVFHNAIRGYYELFHNVGRGVVDVEEFVPPVQIAPEIPGYVEQALSTGRGLLILGAHMSNFDLAGIGLSQYVPQPIQALSIAAPPPGFEIFNRLRERGNGFITPVSPQALRQAMRRLKDGGVVITGSDRPLGENDNDVTFFGKRTRLPTGYMRIPLRTNCWVMTISFVYQEGVYRILANPPMEMIRTGDRARDIDLNVHRVLAQMENFIRLAPEQWMMFIPVWPDDPEVENEKHAST